jgi:hypothetical protein
MVRYREGPMKGLQVAFFPLILPTLTSAAGYVRAGVHVRSQ